MAPQNKIPLLLAWRPFKRKRVLIRHAQSTRCWPGQVPPTLPSLAAPFAPGNCPRAAQPPPSELLRTHFRTCLNLLGLGRHTYTSLSQHSHLQHLEGHSRNAKVSMKAAERLPSMVIPMALAPSYPQAREFMIRPIQHFPLRTYTTWCCSSMPSQDSNNGGLPRPT